MILECCKAKRDDYEACIVIARYAGLRIHEVMRIDTAIARNAVRSGFITIKGKNGKIRTVPINETIRIEFEKFLRLIPVGHKLFVKKGKQTHIAITELQNFINKHRKFVQDPDSIRPLTFHGLRHKFAAEWYRKLISEGKSESDARFEVSRLLGHEREDVTRIYLASVISDDMSCVGGNL